MSDRGNHLATALRLAAAADHYMVGIVEPVTLEEAQDALQVLIGLDNEATGLVEKGVLATALDLGEALERKLRAAA